MEEPAPTVMVWFRAPPSLHEEKLYRVPNPDCVPAAPRVCVVPVFQVKLQGVV